jgi:hypothetical protein
MSHPLAFTGRRNGGTNKHGVSISAGDRIRNPFNGKCGIADEFLQDGDAYITYDDGTHDCVKWHNLEPAND